MLQLASMHRRRGLLLAALVVAGLVLTGVIWARQTLPQTAGTLYIPGLHGPVTVARDRWSVPHIYAGDDHDLYLAQGYVTAQDRLWQILLRRQAARGQLSDWLGETVKSADRSMGRANLIAQAQIYLPTLDAETLAALQAYALGVNHCIQTCPAPPELALLKLQGKLKQIEPWADTDSMALALLTLWGQEQSSAPGLRQDMLARVGVTHTQELWPQDVVSTYPILPKDTAVRQIMQLGGLGLTSSELKVAASMPGAPAAWYMVALHSEGTTLAGGAWAGLPGVMIKQTITTNPDIPSDRDKENVLLQYLLALPPEGWLQFRVHGMLRQWNLDISGQTRLGNASAAVYQTWLWYLARDTFQDELGSELFAHHWATGFAPGALARLGERPDDAWWDDVTVPQRETRDDIFRRAYAEALDDLGRHYGDLHTIWEWDTMHAVQFDHALGPAWPLTNWLNRTIKLGGDAPFDPTRPGNSYQAFAPVLISSITVSHTSNSNVEFALAGGQAGNPFSPHYADLLSRWARGELSTLQIADRPLELKDVEGILMLMP